jgi:hypothetical protein
MSITIVDIASASRRRGQGWSSGSDDQRASFSPGESLAVEKAPKNPNARS